jgi:hypothetical protein
LHPSRCTLAPDFLKEKDFLQSNLLQRGKRPQDERRGCSGGQRNKMTFLLGSSTPLWRRVFQRELFMLYSDLHREGNSRRAYRPVFAPAVFEIRRASRAFLYHFAHFPIFMARVANFSSEKFPLKFFFFRRFEK